VLSYGIPADRIEVIPFGIVVPPPAPPRIDTGLPQIVFVGSSMERKGGWRLVGIWQRFLADISRLVLVTRESVRADPRIEVRNDVSPGDGKLERILAAADIFAMPGDIDAFGYAILEAMAAELPVVAVGQAAVPEIVVDGLTGIVVPPGDDVAFAGALRRLVQDSAARQAMGEAGRARLLERFDARITTSSFVEVIRDVVGA
jgi:glycosyltransferase involved in cell wall biosynthesis